MNDRIRCKWCGATKLIRKGYSGGWLNQKFKCRKCERTFVVSNKELRIEVYR